MANNSPINVVCCGTNLTQTYCCYSVARILLLVSCGANRIGQPASQPGSQPASQPAYVSLCCLGGGKIELEDEMKARLPQVCHVTPQVFMNPNRTDYVKRSHADECKPIARKRLHTMSAAPNFGLPPCWRGGGGYLCIPNHPLYVGSFALIHSCAISRSD